jgi:hypothetical protein
MSFTQPNTPSVIEGTSHLHDNHPYINMPLILILCQFSPAHTCDTNPGHNNLYTDQGLDN